MFYFSEYLKSLRENQRMSLRDVERRTGVSNAYLSQIELGKRPPPHPSILKKLAPIYNVPVYDLMAAAGYLEEAQSHTKYKCLNPGCRHEWDTRGDYAKIIRCPSCRKGYVLDWDTFQAVVLAQAKWLINPGASDVVTAHLAGYATVVRKLFPMLSFNPFQVIYDEAIKRRS